MPTLVAKTCHILLKIVLMLSSSCQILALVLTRTTKLRLLHNGLQGITLRRNLSFRMRCWAIAGLEQLRLIVAEPRIQTLNGTTQAGLELRRAVRAYVRAYASLHGRRKAAEVLGVSRHTLWRFLERGHMGRAVPVRRREQGRQQRASD